LKRDTRIDEGNINQGEGFVKRRERDKRTRRKMNTEAQRTRSYTEEDFRWV
jgi:hypothetical protein